MLAVFSTIVDLAADLFREAVQITRWASTG